MIIEKLQPRHLPQVVNLQQQIVPYPIDLAAASTLYETIGQNDDCCILVAREQETVLGTVSGFCCRGLAGTFLTIEDLIVTDSLRGSGIGTSLMETIEEYGRRQGCGYVFLVSSGFRTKAHTFYEKLGYTEGVRGFRKNL